MNYNDLPEQLLSNFKKGPDDFRPGVMWFWNGSIREDEITYQLQLFKEQKLFDIFIHPMNGIEVEYLSDEYFRLFRFTVEQAKLIGLKIWIYDDYNWPSGSAGGHLLKEEPWTRGSVIQAVCKYLVPGQTITVRNDIISAQAVFTNNAGTGTTVKDIVQELEKQSRPGSQIRTSWENNETAPCNVYMFYIEQQRGVYDSALDAPFCWCQEGYLDTCNKDAVKRFIDYTHERYKQAVGDEFGKTIVGVWTDEPHMSSPKDLGKGKFPWTRDFVKIFQAKTGYDLLPRLCALFFDFKEPALKKVRADFWRVMSDLFAENYMQQIAKWCEDNTLLFCGHFCYEEKLIWHCMSIGDFFKSGSKFTIPGIDSIHSTQSINKKDFNVAGKLIASVADYTGKKRILCETYSCSGWDCNLFVMKRIANRLMLLGVNMIVLMGAYYTIRGRTAKVIGPPTHSWQNPLFHFYHYYSDYISRLAYIKQLTEYEADILVMLPKLIVWEDLIAWDDFLGWRGTPVFSTKVEWTAEDIAFQNTVNALVKANYNFLIGFEELFKNATVKNGHLHMGRQKFSMIILPQLKSVSVAAKKIITDFIKQGGKTLFINEVPMMTTDTLENTDFDKFFDHREKLTRNADICCRKTDVVIEGLIRDVKLLFNDAPGKEECNDFFDLLYGIIKESNLSGSIDINAEGINIDHRKKDGDDYYIFFNDTTEHKKFTGSIAAGEELMRLDPNSGDAGRINWKRQSGKLHFELDLAAYDSTILIAQKTCSSRFSKNPPPC